MAELKRAIVRSSLDVLGNTTLNSDLVVKGNLTVTGSSSIVNTETLTSSDQLVELGYGRGDIALTSPAGFYVDKYDGTNAGALVFDADGVAYVGDVTLSNNLIDVANSDLQQIATRESDITEGHLAVWSGTGVSAKLTQTSLGDVILTERSENTFDEATSYYLSGLNINKNSDGDIISGSNITIFDGTDSSPLFEYWSDLYTFHTNSSLIVDNTLYICQGDWSEAQTAFLHMGTSDYVEGDRYESSRSILHINGGGHNPNFFIKTPAILSDRFIGTLEGNAESATSASNYAEGGTIESDLNSIKENALSYTNISASNNIITIQNLNGTSKTLTISSVPQATKSEKIAINETLDSNYDLVMVDSSTTTTEGGLYVSSTNRITFDASTGTLNATTFSGNLTGNATTADTASKFTVNITNEDAIDFYPILMTEAGENYGKTFIAHDAHFYFMPSTYTLYAPNIHGTASNALSLGGIAASNYLQASDLTSLDSRIGTIEKLISDDDDNNVVDTLKDIITVFEDFKETDSLASSVATGFNVDNDELQLKALDGSILDSIVVPVATRSETSSSTDDINYSDIVEPTGIEEYQIPFTPISNSGGIHSAVNFSTGSSDDNSYRVNSLKYKPNMNALVFNEIPDEEKASTYYNIVSPSGLDLTDSSDNRNYTAEYKAAGIRIEVEDSRDTTLITLGKQGLAIDNGYDTISLSNSAFYSNAVSMDFGTGLVTASTFSGNLSGNATTATALGNAAGSSTLPVYINSSGIATATSTTLDIDINGTAEIASNLKVKGHFFTPDGDQQYALPFVSLGDAVDGTHYRTNDVFHNSDFIGLKVTESEEATLLAQNMQTNKLTLNSYFDGYSTFIGAEFGSTGLKYTSSMMEERFEDKANYNVNGVNITTNYYDSDSYLFIPRTLSVDPTTIKMTGKVNEYKGINEGEIVIGFETSLNQKGPALAVKGPNSVIAARHISPLFNEDGEDEGLIIGSYTNSEYITFVEDVEFNCYVRNSQNQSAVWSDTQGKNTIAVVSSTQYSTMTRNENTIYFILP